MTYTTMLQAVIKAVSAAMGKEISACINERMSLALELWAAMYEDCPPWLSCKKGIESAGIPGAIAMELARLATCEMQTKADDAQVDAIYQRIVKDIRTPVEYGCALGGVLFKPYPTVSGDIAFQYIRADRFFPLAFDSSNNISECALVEQIYSGKAVFTRLEYYSLPDRVIVNLAYHNSNAVTAASLGAPIPLDTVPQWAGMQEQTPLTGDKLPFGYFRIPLANMIDADSPLGVSVFGRAASLIKEADKKYSNICWEYEAKQAAVQIASSLLKRNENTGDLEYPGGKERLYRALDYNMGAAEKPLLDEFSPDIRADDLYKGYQNQLKMIEFVSGLAYGTISDPSEVDKTATEVRSSKQRLYVTVTDIQTALENALMDTVAAIAFWLGRSAPKVSFDWGDSIMTDSDAEASRALLELQSGVIDNVEYYKRVYKMSESDALKLAADIAARSPAPENADFFAEGDGSDAGDGG
ncbi:MAG: phage portal protein [Bacillota bacterium]